MHLPRLDSAQYVSHVQVTVSTILPMPMSRAAATELATGDQDVPVLEEWHAGLVVGYAADPPAAERFVTDEDLAALDMRPRTLRRTAADNLDARLDQVEVHGLAPVFTLSFEGMEATLLTSDEVWESLTDQVEGDVVVGAPARDVMFVTGTESQAGLEKINRACERVFFAGHDNLLCRQLLVRRDGIWDVL